MPPKRKAAAAKNLTVDEVVQNGSEPLDSPKAKRGKAPKTVEKIVEEVTTTRSTRARTAALAVVEKQVVDDKKVSFHDESTAKKKKPPASTERTTKAKSTRGAKKGDEKIKKTTTAKAKVPKKKPDNSESEDELQAKKSRGKPKGEPLQNQTDTDFSTMDFTCSKQNALGMLSNFKISSWNVDGVRAWLKKKGLEYVEHEQPDILCLQEIKCSKDKIPHELDKYMDYKTYWCPSEKEGYAGVAVFSKVDPLSLEYGIGNEEFDNEGRCITAEYEEFYLVNVYVPNAG
ncbi:hypothetical protein AMK59_3497 [Oryctes borbonicus]|uniref:exodeoxyribonuclease III n=1 Tax=Oryctes borbonicus TaxID=1629725 RepID=A0A0T6B740_9SCAR|nr:hypothetical protein AMK59_3497 [Oryctes borbonicus]